MPFRILLTFCAAAGVLFAADFVNPNPGGLLKTPGDAAAPKAPFSYNNLDVHRLLKNAAPNQAAAGETGKLTAAQPRGTKQCSIPLKWAKADIRPGPDVVVQPHPERIDPMYGRNPAPACLVADNEKPKAAQKPFGHAPSPPEPSK